MIKNLKQNFSKFKFQLTHITKNEPLNILSLISVILLDIFILIMLFQGLSDQAKQLTSPNEYIPQICREIFVNNEWTQFKRLDNLESIVIQYNSSYYDEIDKKNKIHPLCSQLINQVNIIKHDKNLINLFYERNKIKKQKDELIEIRDKKQAFYEIKLLEKISKVSDDTLNKTKQELDINSQAINKSDFKLNDIENKLNQNNSVKKLWNIIDNNHYRDTIIKDLRNANFWYPVKEFCIQLLFLIPLLIVFCYWYILNNKKEKFFQTFISTHLLIVVSIPILIKIIDLSIDILPKHLLRKLIAFLESIHLIALWNYIVIFIAVIFTMVLIYFIQKKFLNKESIKLKRFFQSRCISCGVLLKPRVNACPFCGEIQYEQCKNCKKNTPIIGQFCSECGHKK